MKIAFFIPTLDIGGIQRVFLNLSSLLQANGYTVDFLLCREEGILLNQLPPRINLISFGSHKRLRNSMFDLIKYIKRDRPQYIITGSDIHNHFVIACNILSGRRTKIIATQHNFYDDDIQEKVIYKHLFKPLIKHLYPKAHIVVCVSDALSNYVSELSPNSNITRIYNPFDEKYLLKKSEASNIDFNLPDKYILFAGRLATVKNLKLLIDSFRLVRAKFPEFKLIIAGTGPEYAKLSIQTKNDSTVIFTGELDHCYYLIRHARIIALSSSSETLPSIIIESLLLKKTVVSTPTLGANEILNNGQFGYISESLNNENDYANTLIKAINNPMNKELIFGRGQAFSNSSILRLYANILR